MAGAISVPLYFDLVYSAQRFNVNGKIDSSFATNGTHAASFAFHQNEFITTVAIQSDGKIVLGGTKMAGSAASTKRMHITRLNSQGQLDAESDFSLSGLGYAMAMGPADKIYITGGVNFEGGASNSYVTYALSQTLGVFPLHLVSFRATLYQTAVSITWQTTNEVNTSHFVIERSWNGSEFTSVGTVNAKGNVLSSAYNFRDDISSINSNGSTVYYRLKMIDKDGSFTYSNIQKLHTTVIPIHIVPNPAGSFVRVTNTNVKAIDFYDSRGRLVFQAAEATLQNKMNVSFLPRGIYLLVIFYKNNDITHQKLVLQ